jgi:hypothetical protein
LWVQPYGTLLKHARSRFLRSENRMTGPSLHELSDDHYLLVCEELVNRQCGHHASDCANLLCAACTAPLATSYDSDASVFIDNISKMAWKTTVKTSCSTICSSHDSLNVSANNSCHYFHIPDSTSWSTSTKPSSTLMAFCGWIVIVVRHGILEMRRE